LFRRTSPDGDLTSDRSEDSAHVGAIGVALEALAWKNRQGDSTIGLVNHEKPHHVNTECRDSVKMNRENVKFVSYILC